MKVTDLTVTKPTKITDYFDSRKTEIVFIFKDVIYVGLGDHSYYRWREFKTLKHFQDHIGLSDEDFNLMYYKPNKDFLTQFKKQIPNLKDFLICDV